MAETVEVFKNVNDVTPSAGQLTGSSALEIDLVTTGANEKAVIKDIDFTLTGDGKTRITPTLELGGHIHTTAAAGGDITFDGNLIVGPSTTLKIKATPADVNPAYAGQFRGMFFAEGSTGIQYLTGSGSGSPTSLTHIQQDSSNNACDDAVAAIPPSGAPGGGDGVTPYYYRLYNNNTRKYSWNAPYTGVSWTHGSTGYAITADDTYLYRAASGGTTTIYRTKLSDHTHDTLTTSSNYEAPTGNTGSCFLHHDGYIYTRNAGSSTYLDKINLSDLTVSRNTNNDWNLGTYSDGGCIVTPATGPYAGKALWVEQGTSYWCYYVIETDTLTRMTGGTSGSTEYASGGGQIAPGVALIFSELSDKCSLIDMNPTTPTWTFTSASPFTTVQGFGNRFGFADYLQPPAAFKYSAFATGIEIT